MPHRSMAERRDGGRVGGRKGGVRWGRAVGSHNGGTATGTVRGFCSVVAPGRRGDWAPDLRRWGLGRRRLSRAGCGRRVVGRVRAAVSSAVASKGDQPRAKGRSSTGGVSEEVRACGGPAVFHEADVSAGPSWCLAVGSCEHRYQPNLVVRARRMTATARRVSATARQVLAAPLLRPGAVSSTCGHGSPGSSTVAKVSARVSSAGVIRSDRVARTNDSRGGNGRVACPARFAE